MKNKSSLDTELRQPQILLPSKRKWIFIGLLFGFMSFFMIIVLILGGIQGNDIVGASIGFILVTTFAILSFINTSVKASYFKISKEGFELSFLYFKKVFLWRDVTQFGVHIMLNNKPIIGFNVREGYIDNSFFMKTTNGKMFDKMFHYKYQIQNNFDYNTIDLIDHLNYLKV